jgi:VanZ family protein
MILLIWLTVLFAVSVMPLAGLKTELPADKVEHFVAYGITAVLFFRQFATKHDNAAFRRSVAYATAYGVLLEVVQACIPYRQFSFADMLANAAGAIAFSVVYRLWRKQ